MQNFQSEKKKVVSRHLWQHFFGLFLQHCNLSCQALFGIRIFQNFVLLYYTALHIGNHIVWIFVLFSFDVRVIRRQDIFLLNAE